GPGGTRPRHVVARLVPCPPSAVPRAAITTRKCGGDGILLSRNERTTSWTGIQGELPGGTRHPAGGVFRMESSTQYGEFAEECERLAAQAKAEHHRKALKQMAQAWRELAQEADKQIKRG